MFVWCEKMIYLSMVGVVSYIFSGIYNLDFLKLSEKGWLATCYIRGYKDKLYWSNGGILR